MAYFPMFVSLENRPCLIVGGGRVASRKCRGLLAFGAEVTMVAERFSETEEGEKQPGLNRVRRRVREADLTERDWALVIAATDDRRVNGQVAAYCRKKGIPVNVADCRDECDFFFPAYCMEGGVVAGISTSGMSPQMASAIRRRLETALPEWLAELEKEGTEHGQTTSGYADRHKEE